MKYVEKRTFRLVLPVEEPKYLSIPLSKTIQQLLLDLGFDDSYVVVVNKKELPMNDNLSLIKEKELIIRKRKSKKWRGLTEPQ